MPAGPSPQRETLGIGGPGHQLGSGGAGPPPKLQTSSDEPPPAPTPPPVPAGCTAFFLLLCSPCHMHPHSIYINHSNEKERGLLRRSASWALGPLQEASFKAAAVLGSLAYTAGLSLV